MPNRVLSAVRRLWARSANRYLVVGGFCFVVDVALLWIAYDLLGVPLAIATPVAFLTSFAVTYTMQRVVAFSSDSKVVPSVARYTALVIFNTIATTGIVWLTAVLDGQWLVGKILAVVATTLWNYFAYRYWVFVESPARSSDV
jgi:putative flippase GtrA